MAKLLEGKPIAERIKETIKQDVLNLKKAPVLASVLAGSDPASVAYVKSQEKTAQSLGINYKLCQLSADASENDFADLISKLNADKTVNGIIIQMPLPQGLDQKKITGFILPSKNVEGLNPATVQAVMELLNSTGIDLYGKETVIVGHSEVVGKPLAMRLVDKFATVTICHIGTSKAGKLEDHVRQAEILIVAVGKPGLIKGDWIKKDAIVIDVGINRVGEKIVGDVEFEEAQKNASFITPVPGGVGPLTTVILMRNLITAAKLQQ